MRLMVSEAAVSMKLVARGNPPLPHWGRPACATGHTMGTSSAGGKLVGVSWCSFTLVWNPQGAAGVVDVSWAARGLLCPSSAGGGRGLFLGAGVTYQAGRRQESLGLLPHCTTPFLLVSGCENPISLPVAGYNSCQGSCGFFPSSHDLKWF